MDAERAELVRGLFAVITEKAETLHELSVAGHHGVGSASQFGDLAQNITSTVRAIGELAAAAATLADDVATAPGADDDGSFDAST